MNTNYIAFLPGSRLGEVKKLFTFFQIAYEQLLIINPNITIFIPTLPHLKNIVSSYVDKWKIKTIISTDRILIEKYYLNTKFALVCSGTASLEIAKREIPQLVIYKINFFTEIILKMFVRIRYANIINIIANKMVIPELINSNLTDKQFIKYFVKLITDFESNEKQIIAIKSFLHQIETKQPPFTIAAQKMGYSVVVLDPDTKSPAGKIANKHICKPYDDLKALNELRSSRPLCSGSK